MKKLIKINVEDFLNIKKSFIQFFFILIFIDFSVSFPLFIRNMIFLKHLKCNGFKFNNLVIAKINTNDDDI